MLEGVDGEMEAEEMGEDLSVGVVCPKNYEEPESCGADDKHGGGGSGTRKEKQYNNKIGLL